MTFSAFVLALFFSLGNQRRDTHITRLSDQMSRHRRGASIVPITAPHRGRDLAAAPLATVPAMRPFAFVVAPDENRGYFSMKL
jgi:hypothetical protein